LQRLPRQAVAGVRHRSRTPKVTSQNGERRAVTIVFADISDFTGLGERLDPEQVAELVRECFQEVIDEVRGQEGWVGKQMGDAVLAVFGAPLAHEDDPLRAVRAALAIRRRVRHLNEQVQARIGGPLDVHVGINTGLAVIAPAAGYDTADGDEYMVIGDTVTTAARLQQTAGPGQIIVGESTYSATRWQFEYQPL